MRQSPLRGKVRAFPFDFNSPRMLARHLDGVSVLYNTYWVRFNHREFRYADAVRNTLALFEAARVAGVGRIVHISITNPSPDSRLEYFRGKATVEEALKNTGLPYSILRPAVLFGDEGILINNIAWFIRRFPVFCLPGGGSYRLQPIHVDDLALLAIREGASRSNNTIEAIGPETFTFRELVEFIALTLGKRRLVLPMPPFAGYLATRLAGLLLRDVVLTHDEVDGLMHDLLHVQAPPAGNTSLKGWIRKNSHTLGTRYMSELKRRTDRVSAIG